MRKWILGALALGLVAPAAAQAPWLQSRRLDCGSIHASDFDVFSDTYLNPGQSRQLTASCYLIRQ